MINELLGIKYPIIQGAMANITGGKFASVVSNCGALGVIASGGMDIPTLKKEIRLCKSLTDKPFGVNLMLLHPLIDEMAQLMIDEKVPIVITGAGNPSKYITSWKSQNIKVIPVVANLLLAKRVQKYGADAVIAEGCESGGHIGSMTTTTLLSELMDELDIPVISAGGISSGKQMLVYEILGSQGFQLGTLFLATDECPIHENYKNLLIKSSSSNITVTGHSIKMPVRLLKNKMSRQYLQLEKNGAEKMELEKFTLGSLKKAVIHGDTDNGSVMAGLVVTKITSIQPVKTLISNLMHSYNYEKQKVVEKYAQTN